MRAMLCSVRYVGAGQGMARTALIMLMLLLSFVPARAGELRFITIDVAPWASLDPTTQKPVGVFPAVVAEFQRRTGHSIAITLHPFARIDRELETGAQDCTIIVWNDTRAGIVKKKASCWPITRWASSPPRGSGSTASTTCTG